MFFDSNLTLSRLNGRNYVQAVQMLSTAARCLDGVRTLTRAKFTVMTDRQIRMLVDANHDTGPGMNASGKIGEAVFETETGETVQVSFVELTETAPEKAGHEPVLVQRGRTFHDRNERHEFTTVPIAGFEQLLASMLQSVALLVQDHHPDMSSPRLTAFRRSVIPCAGSVYPVAATIRVKPLRAVAGSSVLHRTDEISFINPARDVIATVNMFSAYTAGTPE